MPTFPSASQASPPRQCECLQEYTLHPQWPQPHCAARGHNPALHLLASYVEHWCVAERATLERGGLPTPLRTQSQRHFVREIVTMGDHPEGDPDCLHPCEIVGGVEYGWRVPAVRLARAALQVRP